MNITKLKKLISMDKNKIYFHDFLESVFCKKYSINSLDDIFKYTNNLFLNNFKQAFKYNVNILDDYINLYYKNSKLSLTKLRPTHHYSFGILLYLDAFYIDVDQFDYKYHRNCDVKCSADSLFSIRRIIKHNNKKLDNNVLNDYKMLRNANIFYFPIENDGINQSRAGMGYTSDFFSGFGDRIDYTLYDLERFLSGQECKMEYVYKKSKTNKWLKSFNYSFEELVNWYKINNIFVKKENNKYRIYNLEKSDGSFIDGYIRKYKDWSNDEYYDNLKHKYITYKRKHILVRIMYVIRKLDLNK